MSPALMLIAGIVLVLLGAAFIAGWFDWLLRVGGFILVIIGGIGIVIGVVNLLKGNSGGGSYRY